MPPKQNAIQIDSDYKRLYNRKVHKNKIKVQSKNTSTRNSNRCNVIKEFFKYTNM